MWEVPSSVELPLLVLKLEEPSEEPAVEPTPSASSNVRAWATRAEDWESKKSIISTLYYDEGMTAAEVIEVLRGEHGFNCTYVRPRRISTTLR
jgi:hypothetical protein